MEELEPLEDAFIDDDDDNFGGAKRSRPGYEKEIIARAVEAAHELKNCDNKTTSATTLPAGAGTFLNTLMNAIDQGTTGSSRTGREYIIERIEFNTQVVSSTVDAFRWLLVWDKEPRGAAFMYPDLFAIASAGGGVYSYIDFDNANRFKIVYDSGPTVVSPTVSGINGQKCSSGRIKLGWKVRCYTTTGNQIQDIDSGSLYFIGVSGSGAATINYGIRVLFRDI